MRPQESNSGEDAHLHAMQAWLAGIGAGGETQEREHTLGRHGGLANLSLWIPPNCRLTAGRNQNGATETGRPGAADAGSVGPAVDVSGTWYPWLARSITSGIFAPGPPFPPLHFQPYILTRPRGQGSRVYAAPQLYTPTRDIGSRGLYVAL